jgi:hypothetical protein
MAQPLRPPPQATTPAQPTSPLSPTRAATAAAAARACASEMIIPTHVRSHAEVVAERDELGLAYTLGFPVDVDMRPFFTLYGTRDEARKAAVACARARCDEAAKSAGYAIRQKEERKPLASRGYLYRWVCTEEGWAKDKPVLDERADGEPEQKRRETPNHRSGCEVALWMEETGTHITQKGSVLSCATHTHKLLMTDAAKAAYGPTHDTIPVGVINEARFMQSNFQPPPTVAAIAKYLTHRESGLLNKRLLWTVKQFQNELAPDAASVALDSAKFLQMLQTSAEQDGECVAPSAPRRSARR